MNKSLFGALLFVLLLGLPSPGEAHRSGCHRWHSCPSDRGTYTCGDLGYCSQCPDNYYCRSGTYSPGWTTAPERPPPRTPPPSTQGQAFVGIPRTRQELHTCTVMGNYNSMIYHLRGSSYIPKMSLQNKECFATEQDAIKKGFRRARAR